MSLYDESDEIDKYDKNYLINNISDIMNETNPNIPNENGNTYLHIACQKNLINIVKELLNHPNIKPNEKNDHEMTPFYVAFTNNNIDLIKLLLEDDRIVIDTRNTNTNNGYTNTYNNIDIIKLIYENPRSTFHLQDASGMNGLHIACFFNNINIVKLFLDDKRFDMNTCNNEGKTIIHFIADHLNLEIIKLLNNYDINIQQNNGYTPLLEAINNYKPENINFIKYLLENNADPKICNKNKKSSLHIALNIINVKLIQLLFEYNVDPNCQDINGSTPLMTIYNINLEILRTMIEHPKFDPYIQDFANATILHHSCIYYINDLIKLLLEYFPLHKLNIKNNNNRLPINIALITGNIEAVKLLYTNNNELSKLKDSSYHIPCILGDIEEIKSLLHSSCDPNVQNIDGETPLHYACRLGHIEIVKSLLAYDEINVNICEKYYNFSPLDEAICSLVHKKIYVNYDDNIIYEIIRKLLKKSEIEISTYALFKICIDIDNVELFSLIINHINTDINKQDINKNCMLHLCVKWGKLDKLTLLLNHPKIDLNIRDKNGNTALHLLCEINIVDSIDFMSEKIDPNITNSSNQTVLEVAYYNNYASYSYVEQLMNKFDNLQFNDALLKGNKPINKLLRKYRIKQNTNLIN